MIDVNIGAFVERTLGELSTSWSPSAVRALSALSVPAGLGGQADWLISADRNLLFARWFIEGLCDPIRFNDTAEGRFPQIYQTVRESVRLLAAGMPVDEQISMAKQLANVLFSHVQQERTIIRASADRELRIRLWEQYPRCWICGASFPEWARSRFLREQSDSAPAAFSFVDFFRPRGAYLEDQQVEIEHVVSLASGGTEAGSNLRLACKWCNQAKGARTVLFDTGGRSHSLVHPKLARRVSVPRPFWVVRLLAIRGRCEWPGGCQARTDNSELTVAVIRENGAPNPMNLQVTCYEHDPMKSIRLISSTAIKSERFR